ncbi:hypothetical protein K8O93_01805 [Gordonia bronchialis]|uniref:hypothetical protein n=1 Tax=Gordonia bronchialis TaxID=2054 RepID=UPI001CBDAF5B|nr:hypothetical protein [Gordonia bronchialis]UAK38554.1 hypothetical protein K8O93_01805 [Gordonia bronchialis]
MSTSPSIAVTSGQPPLIETRSNGFGVRVGVDVSGVHKREGFDDAVEHSVDVGEHLGRGVLGQPLLWLRRFGFGLRLYLGVDLGIVLVDQRHWVRLGLALAGDVGAGQIALRLRFVERLVELGVRDPVRHGVYPATLAAQLVGFGKVGRPTLGVNGLTFYTRIMTMLV